MRNGAVPLRSLFAVMALAITLAGCQTIEMLAPTEVARAPAGSPGLRAVVATSGQPRVFLMRGLAQTVSEGVDHLATRLTAEGYPASVHAYGDWQAIANQIIDDRLASGGAARSVVVGHSLGANSVVALVNALAERGVAVDLAVTFDPTVDLVVQGGARRFINFYQSDNGWGRRIGESAPGRVENVDLKAMVHLTHFTIDRDRGVHDRVMAAILAIPAHPPQPAAGRAR